MNGLDGLIARVPVDVRVGAIQVATHLGAAVAGVVVAVGLYWGQTVYPTRTVTRTAPAARLDHGASFAQVQARVSLQGPATNAQCPGGLYGLAGSDFQLIVCKQ